jgi:hypothetical protein
VLDTGRKLGVNYVMSSPTGQTHPLHFLLTEQNRQYVDASRKH